MRLIDADKLLEMIVERIEESGKHRMAILAEDLIDVINDHAEDYEAEPVKHGCLVNKGAGYIECSACGQIFTNIALLYKCCPYCTARFDGGAD